MPHSAVEGSPTVAHFATCALCDRHIYLPVFELSTVLAQRPCKAQGEHPPCQNELLHLPLIVQ